MTPRSIDRTERSAGKAWHPASAPRSRQAGFTLIEVLVALAIVAITLGAGIKAAGSLSNNAERLGAVTASQWCAENQLTALRLLGAAGFPNVGDTDFNCEQLGVTYPGRLTVRPTPNPSFRRVDAQMFDPAGLPMLTISTIVSNR